jgi:hypothetical protein
MICSPTCAVFWRDLRRNLPCPNANPGRVCFHSVHNCAQVINHLLIQIRRRSTIYHYTGRLSSSTSARTSPDPHDLCIVAGHRLHVQLCCLPSPLDPHWCHDLRFTGAVTADGRHGSTRTTRLGVVHPHRRCLPGYALRESTSGHHCAVQLVASRLLCRKRAARHQCGRAVFCHARLSREK